MTAFPITKGVSVTPRLALLLWGHAGVGKTTWAATAPGQKLWISFGDQEHAPVAARSDVEVMDLSMYGPDEIYKQVTETNPFGLDAYLARHEEIESVVVDSLTVVEQLGLDQAIYKKVGKSPRFMPSVMEPGLGAYGARNQNLLLIIRSFLKVTAKHQVHIVMTAHERDPIVVNGQTEYIPMLGMRLIGKVTSMLSEIWSLRQEPSKARNRIITTRISGGRHPMKTRMFNQKGESSFIAAYDPDKPDEAKGQITLAGLMEQWRMNKFNRIPVPTNRMGGDDLDNKEQRIVMGLSDDEG